MHHIRRLVYMLYIGNTGICVWLCSNVQFFGHHKSNKWCVYYRKYVYFTLNTDSFFAEEEEKQTFHTTAVLKTHRERTCSVNTWMIKQLFDHLGSSTSIIKTNDIRTDMPLPLIQFTCSISKNTVHRDYTKSCVLFCGDKIDVFFCTRVKFIRVMPVKV